MVSTISEGLNLIDFQLDPKTGVPLYRQIIDQIRYGIASGLLQPGDQLPTVRGLAVQLKINLNTIAKAYKELEIQQVLETHQGSGTFISSKTLSLGRKERGKKLEDLCREFLTGARAYGFTNQDVIKQLEKMM